MGLLRNVSSLGYARVDEWDPEERKHREAQFRIYKNLQQTDRVIGSRRKPASRLIRLRISQLRVKIGRRLMRLRKTVVFGFSKARGGFCRQLSGRIKLWGYLFKGGAAAAAAPSAAAILF